VNNLAAQLDPSQPIFPGHSTELMGPGTALEPPAVHPAQAPKG
jgi:ferredoxin/flavodoxin---NADP+ reductase